MQSPTQQHRLLHNTGSISRKLRFCPRNSCSLVACHRFQSVNKKTHVVNHGDFRGGHRQIEAAKHFSFQVDRH